MHIAIDGMLVQQCFSGVENAIFNLARALAKHGSEAYTLLLPVHARQNDLTTGRFATRRCGLPGRTRAGRILWEQLRLPALLAKEGFDLLHAPGYLMPLRTPCPVVISVYDIIALLFPDLCKTLNVVNFRLNLPLSIRRADAIIVPSASTRNDLTARWPAVAEKIYDIPLAVSGQFRPCIDEACNTEVRRKYRLPDRFVLFIGQQEPKKNIPKLLEAYHELRRNTDVQTALVIAGGRGWGCAEIDRTVERLGLADRTVFPGFVDEQDLPVLYSLADVFAFPSLYEGFGLPPLEAMACGTPVVTSNRGSLPEVVGDAAVIVDPDDSRQIAQGLHDVLTDPQRQQAMSEAGRERARLFTWQKVAQATEDLYRDVAAGQRS